MTKYSDIEIQTAKNLLKEGYKWIARDESEGLFAYPYKPIKLDTYWCSDGIYNCVCYFVPIFQNIRFEDTEPTSLESIVHPQILDDEERKYLSAVIKPFRDKVRYISKVGEKVVEDNAKDYTDCYLFLRFTDANDDMSFPTFREDEMYEGMERNKWYTLEELGL